MSSPFSLSNISEKRLTDKPPRKSAPKKPADPAAVLRKSATNIFSYNCTHDEWRLLASGLNTITARPFNQQKAGSWHSCSLISHFSDNAI